MKKELHLAMIGMIPGNGHPYSWSALINGYNQEEMSKCPYPVISQYLNARPDSPIPGAKVTHIWTDNPEEAPLVAAAAKIENIVKAPEDVMGEVDGVILSVDDGDDHVRRARPFIESGIPLFVDKPLATNRQDLDQFIQWNQEGAKLLSSSGLRYAPELDKVGSNWCWITAATPKSWERYGIHLLEPLSRILGPHFTSIRLSEKGSHSIAHITHQNGASITFAAMGDATGGAFRFHFHGQSTFESITLQDTYTAFRRQMESIIHWMSGSGSPIDFSETHHLMEVLIAGRESRNRNGEEIRLNPA